MEKSRTAKSARNVFTGIISKVIVFLFAFASRTVFVRLLGAEYTGVNGLYTNILSVLAMADLGISNVFTYTLYQPLAEKNEKKIATLLQSFKKVYNIIGLAVLGIGLLIIPFLHFIVKTTIPNERIILYYILYLINTASTYFFCYKITVLNADQKQYYDNIMTTFSHIIMYVLQLVYLLLFKDYIGYLVIQVICSVLKNFIVSRIADKHYPYISDKEMCDRKLIDFSDIYKNVKSTFLYKMCFVLLNNTDNILISVIVGTVFVGYYSNYYLIIQYINAYVYIFSTGLLASIGNAVTENNHKKMEDIFNSLLLIYAVIGCFVTCVFGGCIQEFIPIWLGDGFLLDKQCVIAMLLLLYTSTVTTPVWLYREAMGLFNQVKYIMIPTVLINILLSIILGKMLGTAGIIYATTISKLVTVFWYEPVIVYKQLNNNAAQYFLKEAKYAIITLICLCIGYYTCDRVCFIGIIDVIFRAFIFSIISATLMIVIHIKTQEFENIKYRVMNVLRRKKG